MTFIFMNCAIIIIKKSSRIRSTWRKGGAQMRGKTENLGMKEGTKSKSRSVGRTTSGKSLKPTGKTSGHVESGHGSLSGSRKSSIRKGGSSK
jgi:hypothetical protein